MKYFNLIAAATALGLACPALAQQQPVGAPVLDLQDALALAGTDQPRIEAYGREAQASVEAAVAARNSSPIRRSQPASRTIR